MVPSNLPDPHPPTRPPGVGSPGSLVRRLLFSLVPLGVLAVGGEVALRLLGWNLPNDRKVSWCREHSELLPPFFPVVEGVHLPAFAGHPGPFPPGPGETSAPGGGQGEDRAVRRIFVLGSSAAHGYGFSRNGSFAGRMQELLEGAWPDREVQVVNAGAIAWSSQQQLQLALDVLERMEPDALVIYGGNNELLEWWDWRQFLPARACRLFVWNLRFQRFMGRSRAFLWVRARVQGADLHRWGQTSFSDDDALPWPQRARLDDGARAWAVESWRANMGRVVDEARSRGVPVILSTVASNWMDPPGQFPFAGDEPPQVQDLLALADARLAEGDPDGAEALFQRAWRAWPEAITHWRWGDLYRRWHLPDRARVHLLQAIRLDENPHRVLPEVNEAARDLARRRGVPLVDGEAVLASRSADGILGFEEIFDHCHPTLQSHLALAVAYARVLTSDVWPTTLDLDARAAPIQEDLARRTGDVDRIESWLGVDLDEPRTDYLRDPESQVQQAWVASRARARETDQARDWNHAGVVAWHALHGDCLRGRAPCPSEALSDFETATRKDPDLCDAWWNLGRALQELGRADDAREPLERARACDAGAAGSGPVP